MKNPPFETEPTVEKQDKYLYGDKMLYGYPNKTFFELFSDTHWGDKIWSVQTKDFPKDVPAVIYIPSRNINIDWSNKREDEGDDRGQKHIFVALTDELISFLASYGIDAEALNYYDNKDKARGRVFIQDSAWVIPSAFEWEPVDLPEEDFDLAESDTEKGTKQNNKQKSILAFGVALLSLLTE